MKKINFRELMLHCKQINEDCLHCDRLDDCNDCLRVFASMPPAKWCDGVPEKVIVKFKTEAAYVIAQEEEHADKKRV